MDLILKEPPADERTWERERRTHGPIGSGGPGGGGWVKVGLAVFYAQRQSGLLLRGTVWDEVRGRALRCEAGAAAARAARAAALPLVACISHPYLCAACCFVPQITSAHGFEEMGGLVGMARLPVPTDKDLLFLIDISYSMDEIAGYEDGMDPIDQRDNRELTRRLDVAGAELGALTISLAWHTREDLTST